MGHDTLARRTEPWLTLRYTLFPSRLGTTKVSGGLAIAHRNYPIIYIGFTTTPESFGEGPVTLTGGVGIQIPLPCVLYVSSYLDLVYIYYTDIG